MRYALLAAVAVLSACGQSEPPPPLPETPMQAVAAPWFICDAINAPVLLVFERNGSAALVAQYDKPNGALIQRTEYQLGEPEGAAGSIYTQLAQNGAEVGMLDRSITVFYKRQAPHKSRVTQAGAKVDLLKNVVC
jgi:hypothetical protein